MDKPQIIVRYGLEIHRRDLPLATLDLGPQPTKFQLFIGSIIEATWQVWNVAWHLGCALGFLMAFMLLVGAEP